MKLICFVALVLVAVPASAQVYLSDLPWASQTNGWGPAERDRSNGDNQAGDGGPLTLRGTVYPKGIGAHTDGTIEVFIGGKGWARFTANVGIDDAAGAVGSAVFRVLGDGKVLFESPLQTRAMPRLPVSVDVTGVQTLALQVDDIDGNGWDHADWAEAQVLPGEQTELRTPGATRVLP